MIQAESNAKKSKEMYEDRIQKYKEKMEELASLIWAKDRQIQRMEEKVRRGLVRLRVKVRQADTRSFHTSMTVREEGLFPCSLYLYRPVVLVSFEMKT